ncbi:MAG: AmmeMemoRadiSam system protein A [Lachnospiraceae bacterium]|nr:AmmeMemoRadiSam system protein A [Lachnospiraceae bacterium]
MSITGAIMVPHPPIILPEVGNGEEKKIQATITAYEEAARFVASLKPETIILTSPHSVMYADYFHVSPGQGARGDMGAFRATDVKFDVTYDNAFTDRLARKALHDDFPAGVLGEKEPRLDHGTMVPLYFINKYYTDYKLVRIGLSGLTLPDHYRFGQLIQHVCDELDRNAVFVGSGDLSHKLLAEGPYGFAKEGPEYDERIMDVMGSADFGRLLDFDDNFCERAAECGHRSFCIMAGALDGYDLDVKRLSHEGTFGVGYGICTYKVKKAADDPVKRGASDGRGFLAIWQEEQRKVLDKKRAAEDPYIRLARRTIETYVNEGVKIEVPSDIPDEMKSRKAGVFVSIHKEGKLRGCIGTISSVYANIGEEIIENAISASTRDPRFNPIKPNELESLEISVDVLSDAEDISGKDELDVKRYGVIVTKGYKRGLLLPNLDGVDTVDEQVAIALRKAGLSENEKNYKLKRFEVIRHEVRI